MEISDRTSLGNYDHDHDHHYTGAVAFPMCLGVDHDEMDDDDQRVERTSTTDDQHDQAGGVSDHLVSYQDADVSTEAELGLFFPTARSHDDVDFPNMEKYFDDQHSFYLGAACRSFIIREADACLQQIDHHHHPHPLINIEKDHADDHHDQYSFDNINNSFEQCQKIRNSSVMIFRRSCDQSAARLRSRSSDRDAGRSCVVCHTTKTPLWRGGPKGPKSLCNACGIRQRKARRAALMAAAATAASGDQLEAVSLSDDHNTTNIIINNAGMITKKKVGRKSRDHHHHGHEFDHDQDMNMNSSAAAQQLDKMLMVRRPRNKLLHIQKKKKTTTTKETSSTAAANLVQLTNYSDDQLLFGTRITGRINTANPKDLLLHQAAGFNDQKAGTGTGQLVINFSSSSTSTNRRSAFNRVFPKDEEEGAVLLMALSCGGGSDYS